MRIIAGTCKGRRLTSPKGRETRPTQDRVREAVFNILEAEGPFYQIADLFAGSGAMGLEAVSRWEGRAVFVESSEAASSCLRENINRLKIADRVRLIHRDLGQGISFLKMTGESFDLIFADPPYGRGWCQLIIPPLLDLSVLESKGTLVLEHDLEEPIPRQVGNWRIGDQRRYGQTRVSFYKSMKG
jgi:16S rRNA (guanine966-N2)-methyltransferase